jgi:hypothetical protein
MQIAEFSNVTATNPQDGPFVTTTGNSAAPSVNISAAVPGDLIIGACNPASGSTETGGTGWTQLGGTASYGMVYQVVTSPAVYSPNYTQSLSAAWGMVAAAFLQLSIHGGPLQSRPVYGSSGRTFSGSVS